MFLLVKTHVFAYLFAGLKKQCFCVFSCGLLLVASIGLSKKNHPGETVASRKILTAGTPQRGWAPVWDI